MDAFIRRLQNHLKEKHGVLIKNSKIKNEKYEYLRKFSVVLEKTAIDFEIPIHNSDVHVFFTPEKSQSSLHVTLDTKNGQYHFYSLPSNKLELKTLYLFAEKYLEDIRYLANNALFFIMNID